MLDAKFSEISTSDRFRTLRFRYARLQTCQIIVDQFREVEKVYMVVVPYT